MSPGDRRRGRPRQLAKQVSGRDFEVKLRQGEARDFGERTPVIHVTTLQLRLNQPDVWNALQAIVLELLQ